MSSELRPVGEFVATDASGNQYAILVWQEFHLRNTRGGERHWVPGLKCLETAEGREVSKTGPGSYPILDVVRRGERLFQVVHDVTSDDPSAP